MADDIELHLRKIFAKAWNKRLSPQQWGDEVMEYFASSSASIDDQSHALCEFMLKQSAIGPSPSPLLLSYLRHAIKSSLVSGTWFFQALCEVASPSSPLQFAAFLELVIEFAPMINGTASQSAEGRATLRSSTERGGRRSSLLGRSTDGDARLAKKLRESGGGLRSSQRIPPSTESSLEDLATKALLENLSSISRVCLSIALMLVNGLEHALLAQGMDDGENNNGNGTSQHNMGMCVEALVTLLTEHRTLGFLLVAKKQYTELWQSFSSKCTVIHQLVIQRSGNIPGEHQLRSLWCALQRVLNAGGIGYACRTGLHKSLFSIWARHNSVSYTRPWLALAVFMKEEQSSPRFRTMEDTIDKLRILRSLRSLDWYPFLCELWAGATRLFYASRNDPKSAAWYLSRNFLLVKLPLLLSQLKGEILSEQRFLEPPKMVAYNPIELSIAHISQFPTLASFATAPLVEPLPESPESTSPLCVVPRDLIVACLRQGLISAENISSLLNTAESFANEDEMSTDYSLEFIVNNISPRSEADVIALFDLVKNGNLIEDSLKQVIDFISEVHVHWRVQDLIVDNILQIINPSSEERLSDKIISLLLLGLTTEMALDVFQSLGRLPELFEAVIYYANAWGDSEVRKQAEPAKVQRGKRRRTVRSKKEKEEDITIDKHELFNTAFTLLVAMLERFEIKTLHENRTTIESSVTFQTLEAEQRSEESEQLPQQLLEKPKKDFMQWYESYSAVLIEDGNVPDSEGVGSSLLQCLYANMAPSSVDSVIEIPPTLPEIASAHTPWQIIDAVPYVMQQVCMVYKMKNLVSPEALVIGLQSLIEALPYAYIPILLWCTKEMFTLLPGHLIPPNEAVPLSLLNRLFTIAAPPPKVLIAVGVQLKWAIEGLANSADSASALQYLTSVNVEALQPTHPLSLLQSRFFRAFQEALPSINFSLYRRFCKRTGDKSFCDAMLRALTNTISAGMSNRHSLRAAELSGCILAYCGGRSVVSTLLTHCIPFFDFGSTKTLFLGQLVAYMTIVAVSLCGMHRLPDQPSMEVKALQRIFEYITEVLEKQLEKPSPAQSFPITFLSLATAIPSIFRFNRSSQRLSTLLHRVQQHDLALGVLLSETVDSETSHPTTATLLEVARCLI